MSGKLKDSYLFCSYTESGNLSFYGGTSPATHIPVVHTLLMAIQSTFDLEPEEPRKRYEKNGRFTAIILVQKLSRSAL